MSLKAYHVPRLIHDGPKELFFDGRFFFKSKDNEEPLEVRTAVVISKNPLPITMFTLLRPSKLAHRYRPKYYDLYFAMPSINNAISKKTENIFALFRIVAILPQE